MKRVSFVVAVVLVWVVVAGMIAESRANSTPVPMVMPDGIEIVQILSNHDTFWLSCTNGLILVAQQEATDYGVTWTVNWVGGSAQYMKADEGSWVLLTRGDEIWAHDRSSLRRVHPQ